MSYVRWGEDGSDVYVYPTDVNGVEKYCCCGCKVTPCEPYLDWFGIEVSVGIQSVYTDSAQDMIDHLEWHVEQGDTVPQRPFDQLKEELENGTGQS